MSFYNHKNLKIKKILTIKEKKLDRLKIKQKTKLFSEGFVAKRHSITWHPLKRQIPLDATQIRLNSALLSHSSTLLHVPFTCSLNFCHLTRRLHECSSSPPPLSAKPSKAYLCFFFNIHNNPAHSQSFFFKHIPQQQQKQQIIFFLILKNCHLFNLKFT